MQMSVRVSCTLYVSYAAKCEINDDDDDDDDKYKHIVIYPSKLDFESNLSVKATQ